jgi:hypothetical protein
MRPCPSCRRAQLNPRWNSPTTGCPVGVGGSGGTRTRPGATPSVSASSARVPHPSTHSVATASTSQCRATRSGSVRRVRCHCQPTPFSARNPSSIHIRSPYQLCCTCRGARSVSADCTSPTARSHRRASASTVRYDRQSRRQRSTVVGMPRGTGASWGGRRTASQAPGGMGRRMNSFHSRPSTNQGMTTPRGSQSLRPSSGRPHAERDT